MLSCPVPAYSSWNRCCRRAQEALWQKGWWNGLWSVRLYHFITFKFGDIKGLVVLLFLGHYIYMCVLSHVIIFYYSNLCSHTLSASQCLDALFFCSSERNQHLLRKLQVQEKKTNKHRSCAILWWSIPFHIEPPFLSFTSIVCSCNVGMNFWGSAKCGARILWHCWWVR